LLQIRELITITVIHRDIVGFADPIVHLNTDQMVVSITFIIIIIINQQRKTLTFRPSGIF